MGASTLTISNTGGTDHQSFDGIGLPGFQFIQDEIEYDTRTHHSNQDVYDRIQADDMKQAAVIMAAFVYNTAMLRREAAAEAGSPSLSWRDRETPRRDRSRSGPSRGQSPSAMGRGLSPVTPAADIADRGRPGIA